MANQQNSYTVSDGTGTGNRDFSYTFPSFLESEVKVEIDNVVKTLTTHYTIVNHNNTSGGTVRFNATGLPNGTAGTTPVRIFRQTNVDTPKATFTAGSSLKANEINDNFKQVRHALQEAIGALATDRKVQRFNIEADAIDGTLIADDVIDSEHYAAGSIDLEHMSANSVDSDQYVDGSIDLVHMSPNSVDSDQYVDLSIEEVHLNNNIISSGKIINDAVIETKIGPNAVTTTKIQNDAVTMEKLGSGALPTDITIASANIVNRTIVEEDIATGTLDNRYYTETELDGGQLNNLYFTETELNNGQLDNRYYTETELLTDGVLDARYYTETEAEALFLRQDSSETIASGVAWSSVDTKVATTAAIDARIIELVDDVGGFVPIANETSFPTENPDINNANNKKGGTIVSVKTATADLAPSGTTVTIADGRGSGLAVIITGVPATIPQGFGFLVETTSTDHTYAFHRLVPKATEVTTVATNAVNIAAAGANVVDINNFADLYQISQNAPTQRADNSSLQVGDLWFDSSSNKVMMVYDGTAGDGFSAITPNQATLTNINIVAGHVTFQEDLGNITEAVNTGSGNNAVNTVGANISAVQTVANSTNLANITAVAADQADIGAVAAKATEIGRLGTADAVADLAILGTTDVVADMNTLATADIVADMNMLATSDVVADMALLATTDVIADMALLAVPAVITDMSILGTADVVADMAILGTADVVADMNLLAVSDVISDMNTLAVSSVLTNIGTVAASIGDVNRYANEYVIQSGTPGSPSTGDLWYNTGSNVLNYYNGTTFVGISPGIAGIINDSNPALANHLDCNDKNLTEVGTVSGNNLQIDFGSI